MLILNQSYLSYRCYLQMVLENTCNYNGKG